VTLRHLKTRWINVATGVYRKDLSYVHY